MSDIEKPKPERRPLCRPQFECEVCGRGAHELEPGNYLTRMSPIGVDDAKWRCRADLPSGTPLDPVAKLIADNQPPKS